jgi:hypothetical protein
MKVPWPPIDYRNIGHISSVTLQHNPAGRATAHLTAIRLGADLSARAPSRHKQIDRS